MTAIAFLGIGLMGRPMAGRLLAAGYRVAVWNRSAGKAAPLVEAGAILTTSPAEAVAAADVVCLCLTDALAIEDLLLGAPDALGALKPGAIIVDFSTVGPGPTRALAAIVQAANPSVRWVDAPVTGGVQGAERGELVILCGGEPPDVDAVRPLLAHLAKRVCHLGPLGAGQAAKLCNQLIVAVNVVAVAEALALARANGIDPNALPDALAGGWADSLPFQIIGRRMAAGVDEPAIVSVGTFAKDLALVLRASSGRLELAEAADAIYRQARDLGIADADATALLPFVERR
ncbi:NAD(P)-dependent oxidoreductase [Phenylobacterium sp.]|uniref:NAD(P)-dependent oxidoreductase n=1 Tax=Phenylobacterium sp. TaxID=1871053 RepID=UPI002810B2DD|nr:NAD(P)-dependent oxidoreductase [Phenylobacterium sp.]